MTCLLVPFSWLHLLRLATLASAQHALAPPEAPAVCILCPCHPAPPRLPPYKTGLLVNRQETEELKNAAGAYPYDLIFAGGLLTCHSNAWCISHSSACIYACFCLVVCTECTWWGKDSGLNNVFTCADGVQCNLIAHNLGAACCKVRCDVLVHLLPQLFFRSRKTGRSVRGLLSPS